jgi:hypothetical protein
MERRPWLIAKLNVLIYTTYRAGGTVCAVEAALGPDQCRESKMRNRFWFAVLCGGLVAGTLDIGMAALLSAVSPLVVLSSS